MEEGEPIEHNMVSRAIERAQKQVEGRNFEVRKHLLEYDDVMNKQREAIYKLRRDILDGTEGYDYLDEIRRGDLLDFILETHCPEKSDPRDWNSVRGIDRFVGLLQFQPRRSRSRPDHTRGRGASRATGPGDQGSLSGEGGATRLRPHAAVFERDVMLRSRRSVSGRTTCSLSIISRRGSVFAATASAIRSTSTSGRAYDLLAAMKERVEDTIIKTLFRVEPVSEEQMAEHRRRRIERPAGDGVQFSAPPKTAQPPRAAHTVVRQGAKVGRNAPCPCGSGKKYKKCCGATGAR